MTYNEFMTLELKTLVLESGPREVRVKFAKAHAGLRWFQAFYDAEPKLPPTMDRFNSEGKGRIRMLGMYPENQFLPEEGCYKLAEKKRRRICYKCKIATCPLDMENVA